MIEPFLTAIPIIEQLEASGFQAYFVGGSVRDYLLKRSISDVDIATSATPYEVKEIFQELLILELNTEQCLFFFRINLMKLPPLGQREPIKITEGQKRLLYT